MFSAPLPKTLRSGTRCNLLRTNYVAHKVSLCPGLREVVRMCSFSLNMAVFATILLRQNLFIYQKSRILHFPPYVWLEKGTAASYVVDHKEYSLWVHNSDIRKCVGHGL